MLSYIFCTYIFLQIFCLISISLLRRRRWQSLYTILFSRYLLASLKFKNFGIKLCILHLYLFAQFLFNINFFVKETSLTVLVHIIFNRYLLVSLNFKKLGLSYESCTYVFLHSICLILISLLRRCRWQSLCKLLFNR